LAKQSENEDKEHMKQMQVSDNQEIRRMRAPS